MVTRCSSFNILARHARFLKYGNFYFSINPSEYYLPLWKDEMTLLKLHPQLTYKQNKKQYYKHTL